MSIDRSAVSDLAGLSVATVDGIFSACDAALLLFDAEGVLLALSEGARSRYGHADDPPLTDGGTVLDLPEPATISADRLSRAADGDPQEFVRQFETADGETVAETVSLQPLPVESSCVLVTISDADPEDAAATDNGTADADPDPDAAATDNGTADADLRPFKQAVANTAHVVYITDADGTIEYVNPAFEAATGYAADEAIGSTPAILQSDAHDDAFHAALWEQVEAGEVWEAEVTNECADGTEVVFDQTVSPILDDDGQPLKFVAVAQDITDRTAAREQLERTKQDLRRIIDLIPDNIFAKTANGEYLLANKATAEMYGLTPADVEGERESELLSSSAESTAFRADDRHVIETGESLHIPEEEATTVDGDTRILETTKIPYKPAGRTERAVLGYSRDITDLKAYESQLESQLDALEVLNQVVRHDIRNDLQLVSAYADILDGTLDDRAQGHLEMIKQSATNAVELTTTARDLTTTMLQTGGDLEPVPLESRLTSEIERLLSAQPDLNVTVDGSIPSVDVVADDLLSAVFRNILKNAVQHNTSDHPTIDITVTADDDRVTLGFADNGPGINDAQKKQIFGRGEQGLDSTGTGIGLYLVDTLVDRYGGDVRVTDNTPTGAVFTVVLPIAD